MGETLGKNHPFWRYDAGLLNEALYLHEDDEACVAVVAPRHPATNTAHEVGYRLVIFGEPAPAASALAALPHQWRTPARVMMNREVYESLTDSERHHFGEHWGLEWDYYYTSQPLEYDAVDHPQAPARTPRGGNAYKVEYLRSPRSLPFSERGAVAPLYAELRTVLAQSNPITSAIDDFDDFDWAYLRSSSGTIASVLGIEKRPGSAHLGGFGTLPAFRRHGFGRTLIVQATNSLLTQVPYVTFGMWTWNDVARQLYQQIHFTAGPRFISGSPTALPELERQV
ncbi:MAG: GNAT family N-acetyltransferase [Actinomycetaceae bacterium]|nr:hypothetical protein [Arcanobacterium sp.]MDD7505807.1 GNAT family N-acetyltransferase [Actinomycetaceae bacterium]MDY6142882.1 GNAT family N-acetyltransferase [Arcanobacterium sp.]